MSLASAVSAATALVDQVPAGGLANGTPYVNMAMPSTSHIPARMKWALDEKGAMAGLEAQICKISGVDLDTASCAALKDAIDIDTAVIVAVARAAAWRYFGFTAGDLNPIEVDQAAAGSAVPTVHADHEDAVCTALATWAPAAPRYMALAVYNSISYETSNHHHLPNATGKLAGTTMAMSGLQDWIAASAARESWVFHDAFHPLTDVVKSNLARDKRAGPMLTSVKFDNLRKRIPVKAPDSGLALNYPALIEKARLYRHNPTDLPTELDVPAKLLEAIAAYEDAKDAAAVMSAVTRLRAMSEALAEPSAYLTGFILGREAAATNDQDLTMRVAKKAVTILGSPAYARVAGEFSGTFAAGKTAGFTKVDPSVNDQIMPRVFTGVQQVDTL